MILRAQPNPHTHGVIIPTSTTFLIKSAPALFSCLSLNLKSDHFSIDIFRGAKAHGVIFTPDEPASNPIVSSRVGLCPTNNTHVYFSDSPFMIFK